MANTDAPIEIAIQHLYEGIKSRFEPVKIESAKGWRFDYPTSATVHIPNPFEFSPSGRIPETLKEFKLERIGIDEYRVIKNANRTI